MLKHWTDLRLSLKIPVLSVGSALMVGLALGFAAYTQAIGDTRSAIESRLHALATAKKESLHSFAESMDRATQTFARGKIAHTAIDEFRNAWMGMGDDPQDQLVKAYITDNKYPAGEKHKLSFGDDGTFFAAVHMKYHRIIREMIDSQGFYDALLIDNDGNVLYSYAKNADFTQNLTKGALKESGLARAWQQAKANKEGTTVLMDLTPYKPANDAPTGFLAAKIRNERGDSNGVVVFVLPIDRLNAAITASEGLGKTGEVLLVGRDGLMRSDSAFSKESEILSRKLESTAITDAFTGKSSVDHLTGYRDGDFLISTVPVDMFGTKWAVAAIQSNDEIMAPLTTLTYWLLGLGIFVTLLIAAGAVWLGRTISQPIETLVQDMQQLAKGNTSVALDGANRGDEIGDMTRAVAIFRDNALARTRLEAQAANASSTRQQKAQETESAVGEFRSAISEILTGVAETTDRMTATARQLTSIASDAAEQATSATDATQETASNVETVAAAAEELSASIHEISRQVGTAADAVTRARSMAERSSGEVSQLSEAARRIGDVVGLIQAIAAQTNLLALNATIEAARAGEAGRGFAVVAAEVKALANQTASATEDIAQQVSGIQSSTSSAVDSIGAIARMIHEINEVTGAIAAAVNQQGSATQEISANVQMAARGTQTLTHTVDQVTGAIGTTSRTASEVLGATTDLGQRQHALKDAVDRFLAKVS